MASPAVLAESPHLLPPRMLSTPLDSSTATPRNTTTCMLPHIDPSGGVVAERENTPLTSDFLPPDLVLALRRQGNTALPPRGVKMPPPDRYSPAQQKPSTNSPVPTKPPANMWNHTHQRARLKHLTDHPPCICGAGRDISFLYDVAAKERSGRGGDTARSKSAIPDTLIPEEYHIVKHPGVKGLEIHDEPFTTRSADHNHHMTIFPSMRPAGRYEVIVLKHTMEQMLERAGVPREVNLQGPTEMHNLLELIRLEQDIYNVCFHELIRQVSVHCVERGELLADLRQRYSSLLDRVPRQVKILHDEVVAQRALDRRLTSELKRFKSRITSLTSDLAEVREHDLEVTEQSREAQDNLATALADSERNANLLTEYHDLYELQRKRLEDQVAQLTQERELWQQASYDLAHKVAEEGGLRTVQRLQLCEKAWSKLAGHFAIILSNKDTQQLSEVQGYVLQWREEMAGISQRLMEVEENMRERLGVVEESMKQWREKFNSVVDSSGVVHTPEHSWLQQLWREMQRWQRVLNEQSNQFSGDVLLSRQEDLKNITTLVENWTEVSTQIFSRHEERGPTHSQEESPAHNQADHTHKQEEEPAHSQEQEMMISLTVNIRTCLSDYDTRLSGENGVATGLIHLITPLETWDSKFTLMLNSTDRKLPDSDWIKFKVLLGEWEEQVQNIRSFIGHTPAALDESLSLEQLLVGVEKWQSALSHAINCQDTGTANQISRLHSALVRWMVGLLLAMTETREKPEEEEEEERKGGEEGESRGKGERHRHTGTTGDLKTDLTTLLEALTNFTTALTRSCMDIIREMVDERRREGYPDAEEEQEELRRLGEEAGEWSRLARLLLQELIKGEGGEEGEEVERESPERKESQETQSSVASRGEAEEGLPDEMSVIGEDDNIHSKSLQQAIAETTVSPMASPSQLGLATEEAMPEGRGTLQKDAEALVIALDQTKQKLKEQEEVAKQAEENLGKTEQELKESKERVTQLESELQQLRASMVQTIKEGPSGRTSRASSKGGRKATRLSVGQAPPRSESRKRL